MTSPFLQDLPTMAEHDVGAARALRVNLAVSGVFHYRQYVKHLAAAGVLHRFYYSHRRSTTASQLGIRPEQGVNLWMKEYLTHGHLKLINHRLGNVLFPIYQDVFDRGVVRNWSDCDILHLMAHGAARRTIEHARQRGALVLGEPVNCHPEYVQKILREEHERLGIVDSGTVQLNRGQAQTLEEVRRCHHLVVASHFLRRSYVEQGFAPSTISVVPYGADLDRFSPARRSSDGTFRVVSVGQLSVRKGHVDLLGAWKRLAFPNGELVFAGTMTPEMAPILNRDRGVFTYLGPVPHAELRTVYQQADVAVSPSIEDGFSLVPLEAMASGVPVIVSENAGASELVEDGVTGFVVPARSPEAIAVALEVLYRDPERRAAMGRAAAERVRQSYSWSSYARALCGLYRDLATRVQGSRCET